MGGMEEVKEGGREGGMKGRGKRERWREGEEFRMSLIHKVLVTVNYVKPPF